MEYHVKMKNKFYAGIGSRETPEHIQAIMTEIATLLERRRYVLRSGGAIGADLAFEKGVSNTSAKEIFKNDFYFINGKKEYYSKEDLSFADQMVKKYHPSKGKMKLDHYKLHARNTFQIFGCGRLTSNSEFIICYTPDGAEAKTTEDTGGSGQAIRIANAYDIPVYNLKNYIGVSAKEMVDFVLRKKD